ncbi:MAG: NMD3-related protein [Candidatus Woesearchaeota archaeon]
MKKFCPKCGKTITAGTFCNDCKETDIEYKKISIQLCPSMRYFYKGKWTKFKNLRELTKKLVKQNINQKVELEKGLEQYELLTKPGIKKDFEITIIHKNYVYPITIYIETTYSPTVAKLGSEYYEGILQVRNTRKEVNQYIKNYLQKNKILTNNIVEKKDSADFYFIDKKKLKKVALQVIKNYSGTLDLNEQLFSRNHQTSKDIFRVNALLTIPSFKEKDVIILENQPILITALGKENTGIDLEKNKKTTFPFNQKIHDSVKILKKHKTQVTTTNPQIEILNKNYQSTKAKNPLKLDLNIGQKVTVVYHNHCYIIK